MYFETIKCDDFEVYNLEYHQKRVAKTIGKNINLQEYINPIKGGLLRCKLIYDENDILDVQYFEYEKKEINSFKIVHDENINYSKKYLNREDIDNVFLQRAFCDDVIIVQGGVVKDTSIANIAIFYNNSWISSKNPLLEGTTRARFIENRTIIEKDITVKMLKESKKIALMNAMIDFYIIEEFKIEDWKMGEAPIKKLSFFNKLS